MAVLSFFKHIKESYKSITKNFRVKTLFFALVFLLIALLLEVFLFNINSFQLVGGNYAPEATLNLSDAKIENGVFENGVIKSIEKSNLVIEFENINKKIGTFYFNIEAQRNSTATVIGDFSDVTHVATYRNGLLNSQIILNNEKSKIIPVNLSGDLVKAKFRFSAEDSETIIIKSIFYNTAIPIEISFLRIILVFFLFMVIFFTKEKKLGFLNYKFHNNKYQTKILVYTITFFFILLAIVPFSLLKAGNNTGILDDFSSKSGNQITQELVDAFKSGQVELLQKPDEKLLELENPYDWSLRSSENVPSSWDHVLFDGKYYSYYGIAPVLLLFLPYNLITGYYFPSNFAILLFSIIGIFFLTQTILAFFSRFFPKIKISFILLTVILLQSSSAVWFNLMTPNFYEIAQSSGFMFITLGAFFLISSGVGFSPFPLKNRIAALSESNQNTLRQKDRIILWRLCLSSVFLALAVLCRPTLGVYCVCALAFIFYSVKNIVSAKNPKKQKTKELVIFLAVSIVPYVIIGGVQCWYNYLRFGSFLTFGIEYSLTINDFIQAEYHNAFTGIGFYNFLFTFPIINEIFPFFHSNFRFLSPNGYYFAANQYAIGLFFRALPMFAYLWMFKVFKLLPKANRIKNSVLLLLPCVIAPLIIIFSIWESGYGVRYACDFSWQLVLGALAIGFFIYQKTSSKKIQDIMSKTFLVMVIFSVILNFAMVYEYILNSSANNISIHSMLMNAERFFMFWK